MGFRSFTVFWVHKYGVYFYICIDLIFYCTLFLQFLWLIQRINNFPDFINKLPKLLPAFTWAKAIGNLWSVCLGVNILSSVPFVNFDENNRLLKAITTNSVPS